MPELRERINSVQLHSSSNVDDPRSLARPFISIVIASRNAANTLKQCLDSIFSQEFREWEIVVMDGGSEDSTLDLLQERGAWINYWQSAKDHGIYQAWNTALKHVTGQWILFLGADDYLWSPQTLGDIVPHLQSAYPRHLVVYGNVAATNRKGVVISVIGDRWVELERKMHRTMALPHQGVFHHESLFRCYGLFDETFKIMGDYEFLSRLVWEHPPKYMPGVIVAAWRQGGMSMQVRNVVTVASERLRVHKRQDRGRSSMLALVYAEECGRQVTRLLLGERAMRHLQRLYHDIVD